MSAIVFLTLLASAMAAKPTPVVEVTMTGQYNVEKTVIFKEPKSWVCKTELRPLFESPTNPIDAKLLSQLRARKAREAQDCRNAVQIVDLQNKKAKPVNGCRADPTFAAFMERLNQACGR